MYLAALQLHSICNCVLIGSLELSSWWCADKELEVSLRTDIQMDWQMYGHGSWNSYLGVMCCSMRPESFSANPTFFHISKPIPSLLS